MKLKDSLTESNDSAEKLLLQFDAIVKKIISTTLKKPGRLTNRDVLDALKRRLDQF